MIFLPGQAGPGFGWGSLSSSYLYKTDIMSPIQVAAFSGGKDSTAMVLRMAEQGHEPLCIYTPTGDELPAVSIHIQRMESMLSRPIKRIGLPGGLRRLIREKHMLPNWRARFCTPMLKIAPFQAWLSNHRPAIVLVGLRADEEGRAGVEYSWPDVEVRYPLREWKWDLEQVLSYLATKEIEIPPRTNCARCFFQTLHEWYCLWRDHPDIYADAVEDERLLGHTYRSPQRDTHPAELSKLRDEFETGYIPTERSRSVACRYCST